MHVVAIWRYPVKSMGGEQLVEAHVGEFGIEGDRGWGVFDVDTGTVLTARRTPELLFASAAVDDDGLLRIRLPDGTEITADAGDAGPGGGDVGTNVGLEGADRALSAWLGRDVQLRRAGELGGTYENPMDAEADEDWVSWTGPGGAWHDSARSRVSLVSASGLGEWDVRRFRTNVVLDGAGEDALVGRRLTTGNDDSGPVLSVIKRINRCVMVTRPQPGLDRDLEVLRRIHREHESTLSIGALVDRPGTLAVGHHLHTT